jgi:hypothetical protein
MTGDDGDRPPGEYGQRLFNPAYAIERIISDLAASVLGSCRHSAAQMTTDGLERTLLWIADAPEADFSRIGGNSAALLHVARGLFRELTDRARNGDLPAVWQPAVELSALPDPICGEHGQMTSLGASFTAGDETGFGQHLLAADTPSRVWRCPVCGMRSRAWVHTDGQLRWTATGQTGLVRFPPLATTAAIGARSTPANHADHAGVTDPAGECWLYDAGRDVWEHLNRDQDTTEPATARSWQRLLDENGPLCDQLGEMYR